MTDDNAAMHTESTGEKKNRKHKAAMQKQKAKVDARIADAATIRGVSVLLTGNGKGKSSSAFGMVMRALGYDQRVGVVQFIKGQQLSGEEMYLKKHCQQVEFYQMATGFTWDTQDRSGDIRAAEQTWIHAKAMLSNQALDLVVLDELTYMLAYQYLNETEVLAAIQQRPIEQSVIVTGRGGGTALQDIMDTVSEVKNVKHGFKSGLKARQGVDF